MELQAFSSEGKVVLRLDPRTKLALVLVVNVITISGGLTGSAAAIRAMLSLLPLFLLLIEKKRRAALLYGLVIVPALLSEVFLVPRATGILSLLLVITSGLITRLVPGLLTGYYLVSSTKISEFVAAMERMHVPQKMMIPFAVMIRFFPTVKEESAAISDAMRMRGVRFGGGNFGAALEYRVIPLLMSAVKIGEELSAAALTRGLGAPVRRTNMAEIGFSPGDVCMLLLAVGGFAAWIVL